MTVTHYDACDGMVTLCQRHRPMRPQSPSFLAREDGQRQLRVQSANQGGHALRTLANTASSGKRRMVLRILGRVAPGFLIFPVMAVAFVSPDPSEWRNSSSFPSSNHSFTAASFSLPSLSFPPTQTTPSCDPSTPYAALPAECQTAANTQRLATFLPILGATLVFLLAVCTVLLLLL